jgi:hypothetical protein
MLNDTFGNPEDMNTKSSTIPKDRSTVSSIVVSSPQTIDARAIIQQTALTVQSQEQLIKERKFNRENV